MNPLGWAAEANALSDVYTMGGTPLTALNLVAWPLLDLGREPLRRVPRGGADVAKEAGMAIVGGHSVDDSEPKYGLAVTGVLTRARFSVTRPLAPGIRSTSRSLSGASRRRPPSAASPRGG